MAAALPRSVREQNFGFTEAVRARWKEERASGGRGFGIALGGLRLRRRGKRVNVPGIEVVVDPPEDDLGE